VSGDATPGTDDVRAATADVFAPPTAAWTRVSPKLITARRVVLLVNLVVLGLVGGIAAFLFVGAWLIAVVVIAVLVLLVWGSWLIGRRVRSWGYAERADDLLVTSGVLQRRLVVVPYGRMQLVDVTAGPLERFLGITTVQLHTAAAATDATIPGLVPGEAARLRDRLAALGEARSAGL
jgi:membrane protein YdbS with pleckstrin-like domain